MSASPAAAAAASAGAVRLTAVSLVPLGLASDARRESSARGGGERAARMRAA
jgi:hypothetical protein